MQTLQSIGEQGLLQLVQRYCPAEVVGDDAAVLTPTPGQSIVVTTDVLVDQVHFSDRTTPPHAVGWRSVAANLSDLAAMGAMPIGITVGLALPSETTVDWVEQVYEGMQDCLQEFGGAIMGGDIARSTVRMISITALGEVPPARVIHRSNARVDDAIVVTGFHGSSRAGLELLLHSDLGMGLDAADRQVLIQAHQYPQPRFGMRRLLGQGNPIGGMDSSDGLADAVCQIARASGLGARIARSAIPIHPALQQFAPEKALEWALYGGEDFELVLCMPLFHAQAILPKLPSGAAIVGQIMADPAVLLVDGSDVIGSLTLDRGFQHFAPAHHPGESST
jgi:thiamine-monophosphate kinase